MQDRKNRKIVIIIEGTDYDKFEAFAKEHEGCLLRYPNMAGGQFKIETVADGFGLFKTVTCVCGKRIQLTGDYESFNELQKEPAFQVVPEDEETGFLVKHLLCIKKHPTAFFGKNISYPVLNAYIGGLTEGMKIYEKDTEWAAIYEKVFKNYIRETENMEISDEERFTVFLDIFEKVLLRDYPEYTKKVFEEQ